MNTWSELKKGKISSLINQEVRSVSGTNVNVIFRNFSMPFDWLADLEMIKLLFELLKSGMTRKNWGFK